MNIRDLIGEWIAASNAFDTNKYLEFFLADAILEDLSVGRKFKGHKGIRDYFESYFVGYNTRSSILELTVLDSENVHLAVEFSGDFPEGKIRGSFELMFKSNKIAFVEADLVH